MITLYAPPPLWGLPSIVPASLKLETWMRMAGIPYELAPLDLSLAPKGKLPFVRIDGELMGDSTLIVERLSRELGKDVDQGLTPQERAVSLAFRRMLKENLYWVVVYDRWVPDDNFEFYRADFHPLFFPGMPAEQQFQISAELRKQMLAQLEAQGMGRHRPEEVGRIGIADLKAIRDYLGDKPFFMGERPTLVDATLFGYLANCIEVPLPSPTRDFGRATPSLLAYCARMRARFFAA